jgi:hypothetical protein
MNNQPDPRKVQSGRLSEILGIGSDTPRLWRPDELAAIFRHQMAAPVLFDLGGLSGARVRQLKDLSEAKGLLLKSFEDLFCHPAPPLELLKLTKDFAKLNRDHPESVLPPEIAAVMYYASIAAALVRCGVRITRLGDHALREGFTWAASQVWIDDTARDLFKEAQEKLAG